MKSDVLNYIKKPPFDFEYNAVEDRIELKTDYNYKGWYISIFFIPELSDLDIEIWNEKTDEEMELTDNEYEELYYLFYRRLDQWKREQYYLKDQWENEDNYWDNRNW